MEFTSIVISTFGKSVVPIERRVLFLEIKLTEETTNLPVVLLTSSYTPDLPFYFRKLKTFLFEKSVGLFTHPITLQYLEYNDGYESILEDRWKFSLNDNQNGRKQFCRQLKYDTILQFQPNFTIIYSVCK